jgi:acetyltransferase EpsM
MSTGILKKQKIVILGAGSFATEALDIIADTGLYEVIAFIDEDREKAKNKILGLPVVWIDDAAYLVPTHKAVCVLGTTHRRKFIERAKSLGFHFMTIIHPSVNVSSKSNVGEGSFLNRGVIIAVDTNIGNHVLINRGSLIGHHTNIGDFATISPGANIAGYVSIGEGAYIGMGAIILDHITIGARAIVGSGAVVVSDVPAQVQVMGIPARITKENIAGK